MRWHWLAFVMLLAPGFSSPAQARGVIFIPRNGSGDKVTIVAQVAPQYRETVQRELGCVPQVAFIYWHFWLSEEMFDFWRWNGRFVLYHDGQCWELPHDDLAKLVGDDAESKLSVPWSYYFPPGLMVLLGFIGFGVIATRWEIHRRRRAATQVASLGQDERYLAALRAYDENLPTGSFPDQEERQAAFAVGVAHLVDYGIDAKKAETQLAAMVAKAEEKASDELSTRAFELTQAGKWEEAAKLYAQAAFTVSASNPQSAAEYFGFVEWCREEQEKTQHTE